MVTFADIRHGVVLAWPRRLELGWVLFPARVLSEVAVGLFIDEFGRHRAVVIAGWRVVISALAQLPTGFAERH
jgi:hypothetical protein